MNLTRLQLSAVCVNSLVLIALFSFAPALQSCGQRGGSELSETQTQKPEIEPLKDSVNDLDKEIEALRRQKQKLDQDLSNIGVARWEVVDGKWLRAAEAYGEDTRTAPDLVEKLNNYRDAHPQLPNPVLEFKAERGRTVYVRLLHGERLTQQMGSAGAAQYLAEATFTLTSLQGVDSVNFEFQEGDHAAPGTYTRTSWDDVFSVGRE